MTPNWLSLPGIIVAGHRVASGPSPAYPYGALSKQKPLFKQLGLDLDPYFEGTLNVSIAPREFSMARPAVTFPLVQWTDLHPPETFSFSKCRIGFEGMLYDGWVYYPHPETKRAHFQTASLVEVIAPHIDRIAYGDTVVLELNADEIDLR